MDVTLAFNNFGFDDSYMYRRLELHMRSDGVDEDGEEVREGAPLPEVAFGHLEKAGGRLVTKRGMFTLRFFEMPGAFTCARAVRLVRLVRLVPLCRRMIDVQASSRWTSSWPSAASTASPPTSWTPWPSTSW